MSPYNYLVTVVLTFLKDFFSVYGGRISCLASMIFFASRSTAKRLFTNWGSRIFEHFSCHRMIVSITGLAKKLLFTGSPTKFVIAIAQIVQTSYRATTNISESSWQYFSTYILVLMIVDICFISFKKRMVNSIHVKSLSIHELLTFDNLCISHTLPRWLCD